MDSQSDIWSKKTHLDSECRTLKTLQWRTSIMRRLVNPIDPIEWRKSDECALIVVSMKIQTEKQ